MATSGRVVLQLWPWVQNGDVELSLLMATSGRVVLQLWPWVRNGDVELSLLTATSGRVAGRHRVELNGVIVA